MSGNQNNTNTPDTASLLAELAKLKAENEALRSAPKAQAVVSCKVSEKGALSVYGLQRFPVTLYKSQWGRLLDSAEKIRAFIKANDAALKNEKPVATAAANDDGNKDSKAAA